jgi:Domain of unknown function (DUF4382)
MILRPIIVRGESHSHEDRWDRWLRLDGTSSCGHTVAYGPPMCRASTFCFANKEFQEGLLGFALSCATLLLCLTSAGCDNSCIIFTWNPEGTTSTGTSCSLGKASGTINLRINSSFAPSSGPTVPNLKHIFVTLQGVEAYPGAIADENSADWQELAPELVKQPMQVDLMAQNADFCSSSLIGRSIVPADVYTQIRLRLVPNHSAADDAVSEQNECGAVGLNCVVTTTGEIRPLTFDGAAPDLHIAPEHLMGGFFRVLPNQETNLSIEFNLYSSLAVPSGEAVRVVPVFTVTSGASCDSFKPSQL